MQSSNCVPINNCATANGGCGTHSTCTNTGPGTNDCECYVHYYSPNNIQNDCTPINSCMTNNGGCGHICIYDGPGVSHCTCNAGFILSGSNCILNLSCSTDLNCKLPGYICGNSNGDRMTNQCIMKCKTNADCKKPTNGCGTDGHCLSVCYQDAQCPARGNICGNNYGDKNHSKCTPKCITSKACVAGKKCNRNGHCS